MHILEDNGNDSIVISSIINNFLIGRILVNDGSIVKVLIFDAFKKMELDENLLRPARSIYGFTNQLINVKGLITLLVTVGQWENTIIEKTKFLVVDQPSAYNASIG